MTAFNVSPNILTFRLTEIWIIVQKRSSSLIMTVIKTVGTILQIPSKTATFLRHTQNSPLLDPVFTGHLRQAVFSFCCISTLDPDELIIRNCNLEKQKSLRFSAIPEKRIKSLQCLSKTALFQK